MRRRVVLVLGMVILALSAGSITLWANEAPTGTLLSVDTRSLIGNRGFTLSWDVRNISGASTYLVEIKRFPDKSQRNPAVADNGSRKTLLSSNGTLRSVDITRLIPGDLYEFTIIPTNGSRYGIPARIVRTAPSPSYTKGHQSDHTVLYKHGSFADESRVIIQGALPGAASAWNNIVAGMSICKDSSSCRGKNDDGGVITITSVATTQDDSSDGCKTSYACVKGHTLTGDSTALGKHIINATIIFEDPGFSCDDEDEDTCDKPVQYKWTTTGSHSRNTEILNGVQHRALRIDYVAMHEFGHTLGLPDYYKRRGSNWDSRLMGVTAIMNTLGHGNITSQDKDQLKAIYARHAAH